MELQVSSSSIKKTKPNALRPSREDGPKDVTNLGKLNGLNSSSVKTREANEREHGQSSVVDKRKDVTSRESDQTPPERRPETRAGRTRNGPLSRSSSSNKVTSKGPASDPIPVIVCDEINEGDTPVQSRGEDRGLSPDNSFLLQCPDSEDAELAAIPNDDADEQYNTRDEAASQKPLISKQETQPQKGDRDGRPSQDKYLPRRSITAADEQERSTSSARSRRSSTYGQGSPKRQGESYVERLAKSRARNSASWGVSAPTADLPSGEDANRDVAPWSDLATVENHAHLQSALANFVSEDIRQSPQRSMSFSSTPLSVTGSRKKKEVTRSVSEHAEINDAFFDSDGEEKTAPDSKEDIVSLYERACRMAGITASSRIARELVNNRVFLDSAGLNTQDIKAVCVALLGHSTISRLDLSGNELSRQAVQYVCELIEENIFITHLFLATCQLREQAVNTIVQTVTTSRNLNTLDLSENKLQDEQLELISTMMRKNHNLRELRLSYCDIDEEGGFILSKALDETNLEVLDLSWNHLRQKGAMAFCAALTDNDSIRELDLSWNGLGREGCAGLEAALAKNTYLVQLNLECNRVSSESLAHLLKGLEKNSGLETLILSANPLYTDDAKMIASVLKSATKSAIKIVDIFDITVDDDFVSMQEELEERGISIYYGNILHRPKKEIKSGPRTLGSFDPILVLFEYMKQQNLRLIDLFRSLDVNRDNAISREELRNGFMSLSMHLPEGVFSAAFNKLDLNSNNFIDIDELKNAHRRVIRQTALMMLRSQRQEQQKDQDSGAGGADRRSDRVDLLHEFQKLVKEATDKRKTVKLKDESDDEGGGDGGKKHASRPNAMRRNTSLIPGSARKSRPSSGAVLNLIQGQQVGGQGEGRRPSRQISPRQSLVGNASSTTVQPA